MKKRWREKGHHRSREINGVIVYKIKKLISSSRPHGLLQIRQSSDFSSSYVIPLPTPLATSPNNKTMITVCQSHVSGSCFVCNITHRCPSLLATQDRILEAML